MAAAYIFFFSMYLIWGFLLSTSITTTFLEKNKKRYKWRWPIFLFTWFFFPVTIVFIIIQEFIILIESWFESAAKK